MVKDYLLSKGLYMWVSPDKKKERFYMKKAEYIMLGYTYEELKDLDVERSEIVYCVDIDMFYLSNCTEDNVDKVKSLIKKIRQDAQ